MAPILLAELSNSEPSLYNAVATPVYTFGQPRGGNAAYAAWASDTFDIYRVVHHDDPVPHLPPPALGFVAVIHQQTHALHSTPVTLCTDFI